MSDAKQSRQGVPGDSGDATIYLSDAPLSDDSLLNMLDALVNDRGKVAAAKALGVNYRTMTACHGSRRVSPRMRRALEEYRDKRVDGDGERDDDAGGIARKMAALEEQVKALETENQALRETVETQAEQIRELERNAEGQEEGEGQEIESDAPESKDEGEEGQRREWRPPRRERGLPDEGVVTWEEQPDEERAFGPAASLVAEWRELRTGAEALGGRVDRARASVRRWELEVAMLGDYGLTLPPEREPLDASRRENHLRWRRKALAEARRALARAERMRWLRRMLTLGLWWR